MSSTKKDFYDLILVGSGFASCFFLIGYLKKAPSNARILVLERGVSISHQEQLQRRDEFSKTHVGTFRNESSSKAWRFSIALGGSSNCWWGCTPRFLPEDFELRTRYGVAQDWPIRYQDLESYYCEAEEIMNVSGESDSALFPRSRPYPQAPHRMAQPDRILKDFLGDLIVPGAAARAREATSKRSRCCASGVCGLCPIDAKFTILNELSFLFEDERVTLQTDAEVKCLTSSSTSVSGVEYVHQGKTRRAEGEIVALGANALFNPFLLSSVDSGKLVGEGLHEQTSLRVVYDLAHVDNFDGSSQVSANGYQLYSGEHRRHRAACLIESSNVPNVRSERGKWRKRMVVKYIFEDLRGSRNRVINPGEKIALPQIEFESYSDYTLRSIAYVKENVSTLLAPVEIERVVSIEQEKTEGHIIGTTVMGEGAENSVIDPNLVHHRFRNLLLLGSGCFPTSSPTNPTLTLSALSLRAADRL